jgi:P27 family predicted phage terminase small subunit
MFLEVPAMKKSSPKILSCVPPTPKHLSEQSKAFWVAVNKAWLLDDPALKLLMIACEFFDAALQAREILEREGITQTDRFGQAKQHPAWFVWRDSQTGMVNALSKLNLGPDVIPGRIGRPSGTGRK